MPFGKELIDAQLSSGNARLLSKSRKTNVKTIIAETVSAYISRYNIGDVDGIVSLFADDAVLEDPVGSPPKVGKRAIREFISEAVGLGVRLKGPESLLVVGDEAAFRFDVFLGPGTARVGVEVIDIIQVNARGLIVSLRAYFNSSDFADALGQ